MCFWKVLPELLQRLRRGLRVRTRPVPRRELHILVVADRRERRVEVLRLDVGLEQRRHVRVARRARAGDELAPHALAQLEVLHLVQLGEAGRHAGLHRTLAQQPRAERVNGAGEEALQIRERRLQPPDLRFRRLGLARGHQPGFERQVETAAELGRRLARERDGRHVLDLVHAFGHTGGHALGEHLRLAGSRARLDEDVREQLLADGAARLLVRDSRISHGSRAS